MNAVVPLVDVVSAVLFLSACVLALAIPVRKDGPVDRWFVAFIASAMALYVFVGVSNALEHAGITDALDVYEDYVELLFVPLVVYAAHQARTCAAFNERSRAYRALGAQHDMTLMVIDTVPCGVVIVDDLGRITFANVAARRELALADDPVTGDFKPVDWVAADTAGDPVRGVEPGRLPAFIGSSERGVEQRIRWPDGEITTLSVSSSGMAARTGGAGGSVVAFEIVR